MGAHGICLHTLLYLHTSRSCLWFVDLHTKLNWRAAALKFHLILSFTDSDLHCETFSVVLSCLASYGLYSRLGTLSGNTFSAWLVNNTGDGYSIWGSVFSSSQLLCLPVLETFAITVVNDLRNKFVGGPLWTTAVGPRRFLADRSSTKLICSLCWWNLSFLVVAHLCPNMLSV